MSKTAHSPVLHVCGCTAHHVLIQMWGPLMGARPCMTLLSERAFELVVRVRSKQETLSEMLRPAVKHKASSVTNSETLVSIKKIREAKASCEV